MVTFEYDPVNKTFRSVSEVMTPAEMEEERRVIEEWEAAGRPSIPGSVVTAEIAERARHEK